MKKSALEGLKVFDLSWVIAGPVITKVLGDYGATVIRLETSKKPDVERTSPPFKDGVPGINRSGYYANWNTSKLSITLNIKHPEGRKIMEQQCGHSLAVYVRSTHESQCFKRLRVHYVFSTRRYPWPNIRTG